MKESKLFRSLLAACIVIVLGGPAGVLAATLSQSDDAIQTTVSYADLDIERGEGIEELYARLQHATRKVCNVTSPMSAGTMAWRACNRNTLSNAVDKFNNDHIDCMHEKLVAKRS